MFINLQKRLLSTVEAFARTLEKHALSVGAPRVSTEEVIESGDVDGEEDVGLSSDAEDARVDLAVASASARLAPPPAEAAKLLGRMRQLAQQHKSAADAKARALVAAIEGTERADERIRFFDGGMSQDNRALLQEEFNGDPAQYPIRILIATDAAREGVNLQGHCSDLFHYDIPWNAGRLEQRNGRIDGTLQSEPEVRCHYFF